MKRLKLHPIFSTGLLCFFPLLSNADLSSAYVPPPGQIYATPTPNGNNSDSQTDNSPPPAANSQISHDAFQTLLNSYFPLTPDEIHQFKNAVAVQQEANAAPPGESPPEGTSSIIPLTLKPGGVMPVVRVGQGMITSLVFTDASGQVWPITSYSIGNPGAFRVQWDNTSGVLMIQGQKLYAQTNIGVMLQGLTIPVMINLLIGQKNWDYLDYMQMDQNQPGDLGSSLPSQAPGFLTDLLNGIPPQGSQALNVSDSNLGQVWSYQGQYLLLTKATLLSPAWNSRANGPGPSPLHAYVLPPSPEIMISNMGNLEKLLVNTGSQNASNS